MKIISIFVLMLSLIPTFAHSFEAPLSPIKNYQSIVDFLEQTHHSHPASTEIFELGKSDQGRSIFGIKIGNGPVENLVVATHHGNEYGSTEVALGFISEIAANPIQGQTIYVIPVLNTWGYDRRSRRELSGSRSYDPNRDYPSPCKTDEPYKLSSTSSLAQFIESRNIINVATLHTYAKMVLYPWGLSTDQVDTRYTPLFKEMGEAAAFYSGYEVANSTAALYPADGTFEDYVFWTYGIWSLLFEMGPSHSPTPEQVKEMVATNVPGLRKMFEEAPITRAPHHAFEGECHKFRGLLDLKNE